MVEGEHTRSLLPGEKKLLRLLSVSADLPLEIKELEALEAEPMDDGGMGSLYFPHPDKPREKRRLGRCIAKTEFSDDDGVLVSATLNVDEEGDLFELDVWKSDFTPVTSLRR